MNQIIHDFGPVVVVSTYTPLLALTKFSREIGLVWAVCNTGSVAATVLIETAEDEDFPDEGKTQRFSVNPSKGGSLEIGPFIGRTFYGLAAQTGGPAYLPTTLKWRLLRFTNPHGKLPF